MKRWEKYNEKEIKPEPLIAWQKTNKKGFLTLIMIYKSYRGDYYFAGIDGKGYKKPVYFKDYEQTLKYAQEYMRKH